MQNKKSFSVIVPCFNSEKYLAVALNSIINAEYEKNLIEVIVVDDGSTDRTYQIANQFSKENSYIKVFKKNNNHWGSVINYVKENKLVSKEYVSILDSDDFLDRNCFSNLNNLGKDDLLVGSYRIWNGLKTRKKISPYWFVFKTKISNAQQMKSPYCFPLIYFCKKEIFYKTKKLNEKMPNQDSDYISQLSQLSKSLHFSKKILGYYFMERTENSMTQPWNQKRFEAEYNACLKLLVNDAQEILAFHLSVKKFRIMIKEKKISFKIKRKFCFNWFPFYIRPLYLIYFFLFIRKYFNKS